MASSLKNKGFKSMDAGKQAVKGGGSGKMQKFTPVGTQPSDNVAVKNSGGSKNPGGAIPTGGSGKMQKFKGVAAQKSGRTGQA